MVADQAVRVANDCMFTIRQVKNCEMHARLKEVTIIGFEPTKEPVSIFIRDQVEILYE
jgi:hypothetical protein